MAYFLKVTPQKNRTYLAIYESFYNPNKKGTSHKSFKSLGSVETNMKNGIGANCYVPGHSKANGLRVVEK